MQLGDKVVVLALHNSNTPDPEAWRQYLTDYGAAGKAWGAALVGGIAVTDGGGPNLAQRTQLVQLTTQLHPGIRGAVITTGTFVCGIVKALSVFNANIKASSPTQVHDALRHLGVASSTLTALLSEIEQLNAQLPTETAAAVIKLWKTNALA